MADERDFRYFAALVAYDGTDFCGFQYQARQQSIQGELETALSKFCKYSGRIVGSGRTDSGVHARGQVVSVKAEWKHKLHAFMQAWNVHLPQAIVIRSVCEVPGKFHPRFGALTRTYCYYVTNNLDSDAPSVQRSPLTDRTSLYVASSLDLAAMNQAAKLLIGIHDFATFGKPTQGKSTTREVVGAAWRVEKVETLANAPVYQTVIFTITANAFLRHMVRNIVGTLLLVGKQQIDVHAMQEILTSRQRERSAPPAPAHGLVLEKVEYPPEFGVKFF